jgi:hypothetical protein
MRASLVVGLNRRAVARRRGRRRRPRFHRRAVSHTDFQ